MLDLPAVYAIIYKALRNLNDERGPDEQIALSPDTKLFGADAVLDSLALVSVIVDVEEGVSSTAGKDVSLTDDQAMSQRVSPFSTVASLGAYIQQRLSDA